MEDQKAWKLFPIVLIKTTSFTDLPTSLVANILSRLPVKTLITSTSVNKSWYALIKNPKFISLHIDHSISLANKDSNHYLLITPTIKSTYCSLISDKNCVGQSKIEIPFRTESGRAKIFSSCNGLICLGDGFNFRVGRDLYLWNPSVKKYKQVKSSCYGDLLTDYLKTYALIGFGFHKAENDYRVVRIFFRGDGQVGHFGDLVPKVEVYSLRSDSWRKVSATVPRLAGHENSVFVNGSVYWLEKKRDNTKEWIVSFDLENEVFGEIRLPRNFCRGVGKEANVVLMEFKGLVSVCAFDLTRDYGGSERCSVWVRKENGGSVSWVNQFKVVLKVMGWPLVFTKSGKLIMQTVDKVPALTKLVSCDIEKLKFKDIGNDGPYTADVSFVESLVLFEGGNARFKRSKFAGFGSF